VLLLPIANPDLWWHLSAARFIVSNRAFPREEWLSHTMAGAPWADFEWGVQMVWYALHAFGGMSALWALKIVMLAAAATGLWRTLGLYRISLEAKAFGVLAWFLSTTVGNDVRPENFSLLFFIWGLFALERRRLDSSGRAASLDRKTVLMTFAGFAVWANLHAGFVYGLVLLGVYAACDYVRRRDATLAAACAAAAGGALVNPYGAAVYLVSLQHASESAILSAFIREWTAPTLFAPSLIPYWIVLSGSFGALLLGQLRRKNAPAEHAALLLLLGLSSATHIRTGVYFLSVAIPVFTAAAVRLEVPKGLASRGAAFGALLGAVFFWIVLAPTFEDFSTFRAHYAPRRAAAFLEREVGVLGGKPMFNPWEWGGFLGYRLYPRYKIFTDGRYPFHSMLPGMNEAKQSPDRYHSYLTGHGVEVALVQRVGQFLRVPIELSGGRREMVMRPFYLFFLPREHWGLVHWDPRALVFVRRDTVPEDWLKAREFRWFRPDDLDAVSLMVQEGVVSIPEIEREIARYAAGGADASERRALRRWLEIVSEGAS
jgi:hypothetical protein